MTASARFIDLLLSGDAADRPAYDAVAKGTLYASADAGIIEQSDGTAWVLWATISGGGGGTGVVVTIVPGAGIAVDDTDPANPVVSATGGGGGGTVDTVTAADSTITVDNADPANPTVKIGTLPSATTSAQGAVELATNTEATTGTDTTRAVTPAGLKAAIDALIAGAPGALDTLGEIASQLATDESAVAALTTTVSGKAAKSANLSDLASASTARTNLGVAYGTTAGTVAQGNDSRLSDSRTPTAHATSHAAGGSDALTLDDSQVTPVTPNDQTGTTYTFVAADRYRVVTATNSAAQTYTVPANSSVPYPIGSSLQVIQKGTGQVTLVNDTGVTLNQAHGLKTSVQWAVVTLVKIATNVWVVTGDTTT